MDGDERGFEMRWALLALAIFAIGCDESAPPDGGAIDGGPDTPDTGLADGGDPDADVSDAGVSDAGPSDDAGVSDAGPMTDAGPAGPEVLTSEAGCFFTASSAEPSREYRVGEVGVVYQRVEVRFDVIAGTYRPHVPDPSNRTEHILFGFFRANQPRSFQRYLGGAAAVDFETRAPHFRMFGRDEIAMGFMSYASDSGTYRWTTGTRYTVDCAFDAGVPEQTCTLSTGGSVVATRNLPVPYLDAATHLSTAFDLHLGTDMDNEIEVSPHGWEFCDLRVRAMR